MKRARKAELLRQRYHLWFWWSVNAVLNPYRWALTPYILLRQKGDHDEH